MLEAGKIVIGAMDEAAEEEDELIERESGSGGKGKGKTGKKGVKKGEWFKRIVSTLIALVTIMGALVAWRANVAGSASGDNDSSGLLALQNAEQTKAVSYIQANGHEGAYIEYLRNRTIAKDMLKDNSAANASPDMKALIARQITETLDIANTSRFYFFPGTYINQHDEYDFTREINDQYAKAQQSKDLNFQGHFDTSDALSNKSMFLLAMLIVLAMALWLLALSEVLSNAVKYVTALGGLLYMILGGIGAYLVDSGHASEGDVAAILWPTAWAAGGLTLLAAVGLVVLILLRKQSPPPQAGGPVAVTTAPPQYAQPTQPGPTYPPPGYGPPPAPGAPAYGPPQGYPPAPPPQPAMMGTPIPVYVQSGPAMAPPPQPARPAKNVEPAKKPKEKDEEAEEEEKEEPFKQIVTVLIATVALIAALLAYLQSDASNQAGSANRNAQQYTLQALGEQTYGASEMTFHFGTAVQTWKQLQILAESADRHSDTAAAKRYRDAMDQIAGLSSIFDKTYFDQSTQNLPNDSAYAADLYNIQATALGERSTVQLGLHNVWSTKASAYIAHLTLLAVALALFGLALATSGFVRYIFASAAGVLVLGTIVWATATYTQPIKSLSDQAVDAYAKGAGLAQGGSTAEAIKSFTEALSAEPGYANALYARGNAYFDQATSDYSSGYDANKANKTDEAKSDYQQSTSSLEAAVKDYEAARLAGRDDVYVDWNLGWAYYLLGRFDDAEQIDRQILQQDPSVIGVRLNLGLALLAQGNFDAANLEYNTAIARTSDVINAAIDRGQTVSSDFWYYLDASVSDLDNLWNRIRGLDFAFTQAPPKDKIVSPDDTTTEAINLVYKLRSKTAAFEYLAVKHKMPPASSQTAKVGDFTFSGVVQDQSGTTSGSIFPNTTRSVTAYYSYTGIQKGSTVLFKIFQNYQHYPGYDYTIDNWQNGQAGDRQFIVTDPYDAYSEAYDLGAGLWTVEMYVDYNMVQRGYFYIQNSTETQQSQPGGAPSQTPTPTPTPTP